MKTFRILLLAFCALCFTAVNAQDKQVKKTASNVSTVTFEVGMHCGSCANKIEKSIPFEKGVDDLKIDLEKQTVWIKYRNDKTSSAELKKAIEKLNLPVK